MIATNQVIINYIIIIIKLGRIKFSITWELFINMFEKRFYIIR